MHLAGEAAPAVRQCLELIGQFEAKFGKSPLVDPDSMPRSVWIGLMKQAMEAGDIPAQLRDRMGFVTSVREGCAMTNDDPNRPETEEDGKKAGALRMARFRHHNEQLSFGSRADPAPPEEPRRRKARALGMFEERNLEGDDEMVIGKSGPLPPNVKWPFPKAAE
ncbi:hypothetical protein APY03_7016 [Variovorax sp. WDL1]|nr:hypothetical protein APY03_7016 [Variovorax sp. WDL1]